MDKKIKYGFLAVLVFLCAALTLGGLGNIAAQEHFYWLPFIVNVGVYGSIIWKLYKKGQED